MINDNKDCWFSGNSNLSLIALHSYCTTQPPVALEEQYHRLETDLR